jgi:uncharacterized repeat protein (TIGR01451 family)
MMRRKAAVVLVVLLGAVQARSASAIEFVPPAGVEKDDAEIFKPTTDAGPYLSVYDSTTVPHSRFSLGYWQSYANEALDGRRVINGNEENIDLVQHLSTFNLVGSIGLGSRFELGLHAPLYLTSLADRQVGTERLSGTDFNFGDLSVNAKIDLLPEMRSRNGFGLAVLPVLGLPTGKRDEFAGTGEFSAGGLLIADYSADRWRVATNLGGFLRSGSLENLLKWGSAFSYSITPHSSLIAEMYWLTDAGDPFGEEFHSPVELLGGFRFPIGPVEMTVGAGGGLNSGKNDPRFRVVLGVTTPGIPLTLPSRAAAEIDLSSSRKTYVVEDYDRSGKVSPGDVIVYTITLINSGTATARDVTVSDAIPAYTDFVPGSIRLNDDAVADVDGYSSSPAHVEVHVGSLSSRLGSNQASIKFRTRIRSVPTVVAVRNEVSVSARGLPSFRLPVVETTVFAKIAEREHVMETVPQLTSQPKLEVTQNIQFEPAKATIRPESYSVLDEVVSILSEKPDMKILIVGHTDDVGSRAANVTLSKQRAEAVKAYLVSKGIAPDRLKSKGRGAAEPVTSNATAEGRAANRRVDFIITQGNP